MDKYEGLAISFDRVNQDVKAMRDILIELGVERKNIETFEKAESVTKQAIAFLRDKANRGDPIIFYHSGYIGTTFG
jgi:methionine synthase I (cobalamin-dependent)